jgi:hypothetical protein
LIIAPVSNELFVRSRGMLKGVDLGWPAANTLCRSPGQAVLATGGLVL